MEKDGSSESIKDVMRKYLWKNRYIGYQIKAREAVKVWREIGDDYIRFHTNAVRIKEGVLHVFTDSTTLANELSLREEEFINLMNDRIEGSVVKRIVFRSGFIRREKAKGVMAADKGRDLSVNTLKRIDRIVQGLKEGELKEIMRKLLIACAKKNQQSN